MKRLAIQAVVNTFTSYGQIVCETVAGLAELGWDVEIKPLAVQEAVGNVKAPVPFEIKDRFNSAPGSKWELTIASLDRPQIPTPGKKAIYWTMWEHDRLSAMQSQVLNACEAVLVPTEWMRGVFAKTVKVPIFVVPLGINPTIFLPSPVTQTGPCVFGASANGRDLGAIIRAFHSVFSGVKNVELRLKTMPGEKLDISNQIPVNADFLPWSGLARWYQGLTAFINVGTDGWGLMAHQAMATGRPVIAPHYGGVTGFLTRENCYPVGYTTDWCCFGNRVTGAFASVDENSLAAQMQRVYLDRQEAAEKGALAAKDAHRLTWENTVSVLESALQEILT